MKTLVLLGAAVIAGAVRYPTEGPIPVRDDDEADRLIELDLAVEQVEEDDDVDVMDGLADQKVDDLKKIAEHEGVDLGTATKKAEIVAAIRAHRMTVEQ